MEIRTKRVICVIAAAMMAGISLTSRMGQVSLGRRLTGIDPRSVFEKVSNQEGVRVWPDSSFDHPDFSRHNLRKTLPRPVYPPKAPEKAEQDSSPEHPPIDPPQTGIIQETPEHVSSPHHSSDGSVGNDVPPEMNIEYPPLYTASHQISQEATTFSGNVLPDVPVGAIDPQNSAAGLESPLYTASSQTSQEATTFPGNVLPDVPLGAIDSQNSAAGLEPPLYAANPQAYQEATTSPGKVLPDGPVGAIDPQNSAAGLEPPLYAANPQTSQEATTFSGYVLPDGPVGAIDSQNSAVGLEPPLYAASPQAYQEATTFSGYVLPDGPVGVIDPQNSAAGLEPPLYAASPQTSQEATTFPGNVLPDVPVGAIDPQNSAAGLEPPLAASPQAYQEATTFPGNVLPDGPVGAIDPQNSAAGLETSETTPSANSQETTEPMLFRLPKAAEDWCMPPKVPPLPYHHCTDTVTVNQLPLYGGLTNSLKMLLLGAILSFEQNRCFVIDESVSALPKRRDPANEFQGTFLDRYVEPIGLSRGDQMVEAAGSLGNLNVVDWRESWSWTHNRRIANQTDDIESLGFHGIEGHYLKRLMLKRMWRPLPPVRHATCSRLENHVGPEEFMAFSIRRGDKGTENFKFATTDQYIEAATNVLDTHFGGTVPIIFVATDDCSIMTEFRSKRPSWRFVSECDAKHETGFQLEAMAEWTHAETDAHFSKFFVELYAMASAKYFIGVMYTNVTWWALFMRSQDLSTFEILKTPGTEGREGIMFW